MKNKIYIYKSLLIIVALVVFFISSSSVSAATDLVTYTDFDSTSSFNAPVIDNNYYPYYFVHNAYGTCYTILDDINGYFYLSSSNPRRICASCSSKCYFLNNSGDGWYVAATNSPGQVSSVDSVDSDFGIIDFHCIVYTDISKNEVFFLVPPQTLAEVLVMEGTQQITLKEILSILPLILVVVVSFIGLRKAFRMLLKLFRKA